MSKEMNAQMITMVGIFTALAFLIFGSISSLDGIFENAELPFFKVISLSLVWGLCVLNLIFIFLYCIGKMTKLNFKTDLTSSANIFQRYPVVWWTNLLLVSLLLISMWGWFVQCSSIGLKIVELVNCSPWWFFAIGSIIIVILIIVGILLLSHGTRFSQNNK